MDKDKIMMIAPCGMNCGDCTAHLAKKDSPFLEKMLSLGFKKEGLPCPGCRPLKGNCPVIIGTCETYECVQKHKVDFCFECPEFPCFKLAPTVDKSAFSPHNTKLFNLCCIKSVGLDKWLERAAEIKKRYFKGKLNYGKGPQLE